MPLIPILGREMQIELYGLRELLADKNDKVDKPPVMGPCLKGRKVLFHLANDT